MTGSETPAEQAVAPHLVILGASGDLTSRLLLPGLGTLLSQEPDRRVRLVGADQQDWTDAAWQERVTEAMCRGGADTAVAQRVAGTASYVKLNVLDPETWPAFVAALPEDAVLYFALPPAITVAACRLLHRDRLPRGLRFGLEKPFGTDLESAREFNAVLSDLVAEDRIFRVDHFLGKNTVLNILGVRFANRIFEPVWSGRDIESVDIIFDEELALEGRAGYYDKAGAMIDMIQSHLLMVMALLAMEEPNRIDHVELRDLMVHVLRATKVAGNGADTRRARYTAGRVGDRDIPNYVDEPGVDPERNTETLAEVTLEIGSGRWAGVPFRLRSGKGLGDHRRLAVVHFRAIAHQPGGFANVAARNVLVFDLREGGLTLRIATNGEGHKFDLEETTFTAALGESPVRPYGEILAGILDGNPLLAIRGDMAEECWRIVGPIIEAWRADLVPMEEYAAGSAGPEGWFGSPVAKRRAPISRAC